MLPELGKWYWTEYEGGHWHEVVPSEGAKMLKYQYELGYNHVIVPQTVKGSKHRVLLWTDGGELKFAAAVKFPDGSIYDPILKADRIEDAEAVLLEIKGWDTLPYDSDKE